MEAIREFLQEVFIIAHTCNSTDALTSLMYFMYSHLEDVEFNQQNYKDYLRIEAYILGRIPGIRKFTVDASSYKEKYYEKKNK